MQAVTRRWIKEQRELLVAPGLRLPSQPVNLHLQAPALDLLRAACLASKEHFAGEEVLSRKGLPDVTNLPGVVGVGQLHERAHLVRRGQLPATLPGEFLAGRQPLAVSIQPHGGRPARPDEAPVLSGQTGQPAPAQIEGRDQAAGLQLRILSHGSASE